MSKEKSEFGKGLVVCLAKFYEHFANQQLLNLYFYKRCSERSEEEQQKIRSKNPPANLNYGRDRNEGFDFWMSKMVPIHGSIEATISSDITLWANGASDHLYEIGAPERKEWDKIRKIVIELKDKGLDMGHGRGLMGDKQYNLDDIGELQKLTEKALLLIDEKLGLKPDWGKW